MNFLVVGATGQVGEALVRALARADYSVAALVRKRPKEFPSHMRTVEAAEFNRTAFRRA